MRRTAATKYATKETAKITRERNTNMVAVTLEVLKALKAKEGGHEGRPRGRSTA